MEDAAAQHQIGAYRIERTLGKGGFGVVYAGVDTRLGRRAAIKQLLPALSSQREFVERFFREARAAASIDHPGIVEIYDVGWHTDGSAYFAMKLLDGDSLAQRLRARGMLTIGVAANIARQVASAVSAAHARGIIHRDLKPDNIVLVADAEIGERAVVLDFGIAKLTADGFSSSQSTNRTVTGVLLGTPLYMSPEQIRGARDVDQRTDVYALGCIVFEMLAGRPPFQGTPGEVVGLHQFVAAPTVRSIRADVPAALDDVIARAIAKEPAQRYRSLDELAAALAPFTSIDTPPPARSEAVSVVDPHAQTMASMSSAPTALPEPTPPHRRRVWPYAVAAVALIATGIGLVVSARSNDATSPAPVVADASVAIAQDAHAPIVLADVRVRCRELEQARRWNELLQCIGPLRHSDDAEDVAIAKQLDAIGIRERNADDAFARATKALASESLKGGFEAIHSIPPDSYVRARAEAAFAAAEDRIVTAAIATLRAEAKACDTYSAALEQRRREQGDLYWIGVATRLACPSDAPVPASTGCAGNIHEVGNAQMVRGRYAEAVRTFRYIVEDCGTNNPMTPAKLVAAACAANDKATAIKYFAPLHPLAKITVGRICRDRNVSLDR